MREMKTIDLFRPRMSLHAAYDQVVQTLSVDKDGRVYLGQGKKVDAFEEKLKAFLQSEQDVLTVNSCTSALDLALHLTDVIPEMAPEGTSKTVVTTPMTCTATNSPIVTRGAAILWADVDPITGLIDARSVKEAVEEGIEWSGRPPKAIMAVDWAGRLCDYGALRGAAGGIPIIQDAAHSFGAELGGMPMMKRMHGDYVCFSFQAIKTLTTGDGGALICPNTEQTERARLLRWYGLDRRGKADFRCEQMIEEVGYKYHMNDIAAGIGLVNIYDVPDTLWIHRNNAETYRTILAGHSQFLIPPQDDGSAWWLFTLLVSDRDSFIAYLKERGIAASPVHARNDTHPAFKRVALNGKKRLPGVDYFAAHEVAIPAGWWLQNEDKLRVLDAVLGWAKSAPNIAEPPY